MDAEEGGRRFAKARELIGLTEAEYEAAAAACSVLGEPLRLEYVQGLAPAALCARDIRAEPWYAADGHAHRLRRLIDAGLVLKTGAWLGVNAEALSALARYFDAALLASSSPGLTAGAPEAAETDLRTLLVMLSETKRRLIFEQVIEQPSRIGRIPDAVGVTRPDVSHHMRLLASAGLVWSDGARRFHARPEPLRAGLIGFRRLWFLASVGRDNLARRRVSLGDLGF